MEREMGVENKSDDSSDSDDSSKSEDDDENDIADEEMDKKITELQQTISSNLYSYNPHVELIKLLRKNGDLDQLTSARERMSSIFPLNDELWLEWLRDEMKYADSSDRPKVVSLFERAIKDYSSVAIWLEYVQHSIGGMSEPGGIETVRETFERALTAVGINVACGTMLWEAYREFESAILAGLQPMPGSVATADEMKQIETQTGRINKLFQRQLSVPLIDMEKTLEEYKEWIDGEIDSETSKKYDKAFAKLQQILPFEKSLVHSEPPHLAEYVTYIEYETKQGDPVRVVSLYERAITDNCLQADLWLRYVRYVESTVKSADVLLPIYERALRNCPWSVSIWTGYMVAMERLTQGHDKIVDLFNRALASGFTQGSEFLSLWMAYLDYLRRRIHWNDDHHAELDALRVAFEQAIWHLIQNYPVDGDTNGTLTKYWAFVEAKFCQNMSKARELWSGLLQSGFGSQAMMCLEYVRLERAYGDVKHCRRLFHRIVNSVSDYPELVCEQYIQFEREEGDLESYLEAVHRCDDQIKKIQERRAKEAEKEAQVAEQKKADKAEKKRQAKYKKASTAVSTAQPELRPYSKSRPPPGSPHAKNSGLAVGVPSASDTANSSNATVFVRGQKRKLPDDTEVESSATDSHQQKQLNTAANTTAAGTAAVFKAPPPPGYIPKSTPSVAESAAKKLKVEGGASTGDECQFVGGDNSSQSSQPVTGTSRPVGGASKDSCTVFVSNLDFSITSEQIKDIFVKVGEISEVRLVTNFSGKSKGFAYVEFRDEFPVSEALKLDRQLVCGRPMFVSPCNPSNTGHKFKFNTGLEKNKLFIKGLPFSITKEDLEQLFGTHGKLKEVRIVTYRNGKPKGLAYVDYESEVAAAQAVLRLDGHVIDDHVISVAISNPPTRSTSGLEQLQSPAMETTTFLPSLGGGKRETAEHGKARTRLALVPRSVQRPASSSAPTGSHTVDSTVTSDNSRDKSKTQPSTTNEEFRNMLLGRQ